GVQLNEGSVQERDKAVSNYNTGARRVVDLGHDLPKLWAAYKSDHPSSSLQAWDGALLGLHKWWSIRYPGFPTNRAVEERGSIFRVSAPAAHAPANDEYALCLEEMDELFEVVALLDHLVGGVRHAIGAAAGPFGDG